MLDRMGNSNTARNHGASRRTKLALGALGALVTAAAVPAVAIAVTGQSRPSAVASRPAATPTGGMRGGVAIMGSGIDGKAGYISVSQCFPCHIIPGSPGPTRSQNWLVTTKNGGRTWSVKRSRWVFGDPASDSPPVSWTGSSGWTTANRHDLNPGDAGSSPLTLRAAVSHDGGVTWTVTGRLEAWSTVSAADGGAWAADCYPSECPKLLRGPASGSRLTPVPAPPLPHTGMWEIAAVNATSVYVYQPGSGATHAFVTDDRGRSWQRVPVCADAYVATGATGTLWRECGAHGLGISTDGGRHWVDRRLPSPTAGLFPASAQTAWSVTGGSSAIMRTDDGGRSWQTVLRPKVDYRAGDTASFDAQSAKEAQVVVAVSHTDAHGEHLTNLIVDRTTDGGAHWDRIPVTLPPG